MTDEELYTLFDDSDDPSDGMAGYRAIYQAGYRAAMELVQAKWKEINEHATNDFYLQNEFESWLDEQVRKEV